MQLKEWAIGFLKHKDLFTKQILGIEDNNNQIIIKYKDRDVILLIAPTLYDSIEDVKDHMVIVTANKKVNLDCLIQNWHNLKNSPDLTIYFVNPDSSKEQKWVLKPYLHNKIADEDNFRGGLLTLFESVDES